MTRQLDLLAEEVKYLRELINSAYAEEWRLLRSFFGLNAAELHSEIAGRHFSPAVLNNRASTMLRNDQPRRKLVPDG